MFCAADQSDNSASVVVHQADLTRAGELAQALAQTGACGKERSLQDRGGGGDRRCKAEARRDVAGGRWLLVDLDYVGGGDGGERARVVRRRGDLELEAADTALCSFCCLLLLVD